MIGPATAEMMASALLGKEEAVFGIPPRVAICPENWYCPSFRGLRSHTCNFYRAPVLLLCFNLVQLLDCP